MDKTLIWVTFQKEGIHRYPRAGTDPALEDVSFLAHPHRHMFHFKVQVEVFHDDRDLEFIQFKRWCQQQFDDGVIDIDYKSCEMLADELSRKITKKWPGRDLTVSVSEDDENGAIKIITGV